MKKTWIHELADWPNFYWNDKLLLPKLNQINQSITDWNLENKKVREIKMIYGFTEEDEENLFTEAIIKSSKIEGEYLDEREVRNSISKRLQSRTKRRKSHGDFDGMVDMIIDANWNFSEPLTKKRLFNWHLKLFRGFKGVGMKVGSWRDGYMQVSSEEKIPDDEREGKFPPKREVIHYIAPNAADVHVLMDKFIKWFDEETDLDLKLKAGIAHLWFELIHPFEDGNGRIGRAVCDMMLARSNNNDEPFHNLSGQIEEELDEYYAHLEKQARNKTLDITEWLIWFLDCLSRSIESARKILNKTEEKMKILILVQKFFLNERQVRVIRKMLDNEFKGKMNTSRYFKAGKCNSMITANRDIGILKNLGIFIENSGGGRSTSYRLITWEDIEKSELNRKIERNQKFKERNPKF